MTRLTKSEYYSKIMFTKLNYFFKKNILLVFILSCFVGFAQQTITGTISDQDGVPLPGVNVVIKGTNTKYGKPILLNLLSMNLIIPCLRIIISAKNPLIIIKRGILNPCIINNKIPYPSFIS